MKTLPGRIALTLILALILVLSLASVALGEQWSDLPESVTAEYGLTESQIAGISQGYNGIWRPWDDITRAQFIKMAVTAFHTGTADPASPSFSDVPQGSPYYQYIEGAKAAGLVNGTTDSTFSPEAPITRQEAIGIIARRAASLKNFDLADKYAADDVDSLLANFGDSAGVSVNLKSELAFAFEYGIVKGAADGSLNPLLSLWRVQAAALLIRSEALTAPPRTGSVVSIATTLGGKLMHEIGVRYPDSGVGWILNQVGLGMTVADQTLQLLKDVSVRLNEISNQISDLQNQLANTNYNVLAASLGEQVSNIQTGHQLLTSLAASPVGSQNQIDDIYDLIHSRIIPGKNQISNAMLGIGFADGGLIKSWSRAVAGSQHFFNKAASDAQRAMYYYWLDLQAIQEELIIEYMHYREYTLKTIGDEFDNYVLSVQTQRELFPREMPDDPTYPGRVYVIRSATGPAAYDIMVHAHVFATRTPMNYNTALSTLAGINQSGGYGFTNWRLPSWDEATRESPEVESMFGGCPEGTMLNLWMRGKGWDFWEFPASFHPLLGPSLHWTFWIDSLNRTPQYFFFAEDGDTGYVSGTFAHVLPVRYLGAGEFYFYR